MDDLEQEERREVERAAKLFSFDEVRPQPATFTLPRLGKEIRLRPVSQFDREWLAKAYPDIQRVIKFIQVEPILTIALRFMHPEDRAYFMQEREETVYNAETEQDEKIKVRGLASLKFSIEAPGEVIDILRAILTAIGLGNPLLSRIERAELEEKKRIEEETGRTTPANPHSVGEKSSTD